MDPPPNIYCHARAPAVSNLDDYTFNRLDLVSSIARKKSGGAVQGSQHTSICRTANGGNARSNPGNVQHVDDRRLALNTKPINSIEDLHVKKRTRSGRQCSDVSESVGGSSPYSSLNKVGEKRPIGPGASRHPYNVVPTRAPFGGVAKFHYPRKPGPSRVSRRLAESCPALDENMQYKSCSNPFCEVKSHICYPGHTFILLACPDFICDPPMCMVFYFDNLSQSIRLPRMARTQLQHVVGQVSGRGDMRASGSGGGGVPLGYGRGAFRGAGWDERLVKLEALLDGYEADTEDGGNGYGSDGDEDYESEDGEDSDDTIQAWKF